MKPTMAFHSVRSCSVGKFAVWVMALCGLAGAVSAQTCVLGGFPVFLHGEGLVEPLADLTVTCTGGTLSSTASISLYVSLNATVTNRQDADGVPVGISITGATGSFRLSSPTTLSFDSMRYTVTGTPQEIRLKGIRVAVSTLGGNASVVATVFGAGATLSNAGVPIFLGTTGPSLLTSAIYSGVPCRGSQLPSSLDYAGFMGISAFSTVRVTEAATASLAAKRPGEDSGTRLLVKISGYGPGSRVFIPDAIVGNSGTQATSTGAFFNSINSGIYTPGANQMLLARVISADTNAAGGSPAFSLPGGVTTFSTMTEVTMTGGAGSVIYEVLDANSNLTESLQLPVFVVVPATSCPSTLLPAVSVVLGPLSTVATSSATEPMPRFIAAVPGSDCLLLNDCAAPYFPKLLVDQTPITLSGNSLGSIRSATVLVDNAGSGILPFTTSVQYSQGSGWLSVTPPAGLSGVALQVTANPGSLAPGTYAASVTVAGGAFGSAVIPVTFTVGPVGVVIQNIGNAASFQYGTVAAGSYAVLYGQNLAGKNVSVSFSGLLAELLYKSATQINLIVPATLRGVAAAAVTVTVDGVASEVFRVSMTPNSPGIFTPGIVNFTGGQVNTVTNPVSRGDFALVFLTGLADPLTGPVTVNIGSQSGLIPAFAGPQGLAALFQVNVVVPASLPATPNPVPLQVCAGASSGAPVCSNTVNLYLQ